MVRSKDTQQAFVAVAGVVCLSALVACTGMVIGSDPNGGTLLGTDGQQPGGGGSGNGTGAGNAGMVGVGGLATMKPIDPGSSLIHRLNTNEYNNTVADVLGTTVVPGDGNWASETAASGFDNDAASQFVDAKQYKLYYDASNKVAADVFANPALKAKIVTCATQDDAACVDGIINATGLKIFRRPLTSGEVTTYHKVYTDARALSLTHEPALQQVVTALLASAEFLFRMEFDPDPASTVVHDLSGYELASRLSYFLWQSAPDDTLLKAAAADLPKSETLAPQFDRLSADPKYTRSTRGFIGQWLGIRKVASHAVKPEFLPDWSPALGAAMAEEAYSYFDEFAKTPTLKWQDFITADVNFVDANLAKLYGMPAPASGTQRVTNKDDHRFGFLGMGAFLALSSYEYRTAPTLRGRWILLNLLCEPPREPPAGIKPLDSMPNVEAAEQNVRARLEAHRKSPSCAACHAVLDPWGLALENFDAIGKYRDAYKTAPIDASTETTDHIRFTGLQGMVDQVLKEPNLTTCVEQKLFTYSLGREVTPTDKPYIAEIDKAWTADTPSLPRLIKGLVMADTFRKRHGGQ